MEERKRKKGSTITRTRSNYEWSVKLLVIAITLIIKFRTESNKPSKFYANDLLCHLLIVCTTGARVCERSTVRVRKNEFRTLILLLWFFFNQKWLNEISKLIDYCRIYYYLNSENLPSHQFTLWMSMVDFLLGGSTNTAAVAFNSILIHHLFVIFLPSDR